MNAKMNFYLSDMVRNEAGASNKSINSLQAAVGFEFPISYINLMKEFDGGEGEIGENSWLCIFPIHDLLRSNKNYGLLTEEIPDYFLFGKDAADTGYAFHKIKKLYTPLD